MESRLGGGALVWLGLVAVLLSAQVTYGAPPFVPIAESVMQADDGINYRLPNDTLPIRYDVFLTTRIDQEDFNYDGHVDITIRCVTATNKIVMHNRHSDISEILLKSGETVTPLEVFETDLVTEFLTIDLAANLVVGQEYTVSITFIGNHTVDNFGWYRASYTNDNGEVVWFATSDFEAPDARQAFPCYDEPDKKAIFRFEITNNIGYHAISNMPIIDVVTNVEDGTQTTYFEDTPAMSTYLLAFVVSDFEKNCKKDSKGRDECVYARPNGMHLTPWALETAVLGLVELEKILNVDYSLPKMDQIAIPDKDFASGAMENWGLVTYRETRLLIDESHYNYKEKDYIGTVILHEFAHQWFGDLVSPKWWTYLWLNEGFATLFEYYATDKVYPDMRLPDLMVLECIHNIMVTDAGDTPRPMTHYVEQRTDVRSLFDYVSYQKSGTVLRMMMLALGQETFYKGLSYYQTEMAYKNAVQEDLFAGIQKAVDEASALPEGLDVKTIMTSWTMQGGYPVITATRGTNNVVTLTQKKFKVNDANTPASNFYIPITKTESQGITFADASTKEWFRGDAAQYTFSVNAASTWYMLNKQQSAYYRVNYDEANWRALASSLRTNDYYKNINVLNRAQLLDDSFDLAINDRLNVTIPFDVFRFLENETDYIPWGAVENGLNYYYNRLKVSDHSATFNELLKNMTTNLYSQYKAVASPNDVYFTHLARNYAIRWACRVGNVACQKDATEIISKHFNNGVEFDPNYTDIIACAGFRTINAADFELYWENFDTLTTTATRNSAIDRMICSYNVDILTNVLNAAINETSPFTATERIRLLTQLAIRDVVGLELVLDFMEENNVVLKALINSNQMTSMFGSIASASYSAKFATNINTVAKIFENHLGAEALTQISTQLNTNLAWMNKDGNMIIRFVTEQTGAASTIFVSSFLIAIAALISFLRL